MTQGNLITAITAQAKASLLFLTDQAMGQLWNTFGDYLATIGAAHHCTILLFFYPKAKNVDFEIPLMVKFSLYDFTCVFDTLSGD